MKIKTKCCACNKSFTLDVPPELKSFNFSCPDCLKKGRRVRNDSTRENLRARFTFHPPIYDAHFFESRNISSDTGQLTTASEPTLQPLNFYDTAYGTDLATATPPNPYLNTTVSEEGDSLTFTDIITARELLERGITRS